MEKQQSQNIVDQEYRDTGRETLWHTGRETEAYRERESERARERERQTDTHTHTHTHTHTQTHRHTDTDTDRQTDTDTETERESLRQTDGDSVQTYCCTRTIICTHGRHREEK